MNAAAGIATAARQFHEGDLAAAAATCRFVLSTAPGNAEATHLLGLIARREGRVDEAERLVRRSIEMRPDNAEYRVNLSNLLVATGRLQDAAVTLNELLRTEPRNRAARLALARVLNQGGAHEAAEAHGRQLLEANPDDAEAWSVIGDALRDRSRLSEAEGAFREALRRRPDYAIAQHNLGAVLARMRRAEEALAAMDEAARLGVRGAEIDTNRASALIELQQYAEAQHLLEAAIAVMPTSDVAHERLAKLRYMLGDEHWHRDLDAAIAQHGSLRLEFVLGDLLRRAGRHDRALEILSAIARRFPNTPEVESSIAVVLQETGRLSEALARARAASARNAADPAIAENLVAILLQSELPEEAAPVIAQWQQKQPQDQRWITYEATAAALLDRSRYRELFDFERFVRAFDVEPPSGASVETFNAELARRLNERHALSAHPLEQSLRNGTQTSRELTHETDEVIRQFFAAIRDPLAQYCAELGRDAQHPFVRRNNNAVTVVGSWSVRLVSGGYHVNHIHPEGWISSAYYVDVPSEILSQTERSGWIGFGAPRMPVPGVEAEHFVQPKRGRLVLFPSYMWHGTTPLRGAEPRLTIAFDARPVQQG